MISLPKRHLKRKQSTKIKPICLYNRFHRCRPSGVERFGLSIQIYENEMPSAMGDDGSHTKIIELGLINGVAYKDVENYVKTHYGPRK